MIASLGLIFAAALYLASVTILFKTSGFKKVPGQARTFLHFRNSAVPLEQGVIGLFQGIIGIIWLMIWTLFLVLRWDSFYSNITFLLPHVIMQFVTGVGLLLSGIVVILEWKYWQRVYISSLILLICDTAASLLVYGSQGHGETLTMRFLGIWSFCVAGIMTLSFFLLQRSIKSAGKYSAHAGQS